MLDILTQTLNGLESENPLKGFLLQSIKDNTLNDVLNPSAINYRKGLQMILANSQLAIKKPRSTKNSSSEPSDTNQKKPKGEAVRKDTEPIDLRPVCMLFRGIKRFPATENETFQVNFYHKEQKKDKGIGAPEDLSIKIQRLEEARPVSTIFLGANGVGKSSVFLALELAALQDSNSLKSRGIKTAADMIKAIANDPQGQQDLWQSALFIPQPEIWQKFHLYKSPLPTKILPAYFYAEEDYNILSEENCSRQYLTRQMGNEHIFELDSKLQSIIKNIQDSQILANQITAIEEVIKDPEKKEKRIRPIINQFNRSHTINYPACKKARENGALPNLQEIQSLISDIINQILESLQNIAEEIIPELFKAHLDPSFKEEIHFKFNQPSPEIHISHINAKGEMVNHTPREYFNTFRFTLYVIALKISLAFTAMKISNTVFPIVLDDVFDSTDFKNRYGIRRFMATLAKIHQNSENLKRYPLQLILFTQDEIIADATYHGIKDVLGADKVKLSRIFDHREAIKDPAHKDTDAYTVTIDGEDLITINLDAPIC